MESGEEKTTYFLRLKKMCGFEKASNRKDVTSGVHENEEENTSQVDSWETGILIDDVEHKTGNTFHQGWIEGEEELEKDEKRP